MTIHANGDVPLVTRIDRLARSIGDQQDIIARRLGISTRSIHRSLQP